jgi:hypothetical protein
MCTWLQTIIGRDERVLSSGTSVKVGSKLTIASSNESTEDCESNAEHAFVFRNVQGQFLKQQNERHGFSKSLF